MLAILIAVYSAAGYWLAPRLLHDALVGLASERFGHSLALRELRVDPWRLTIELEGARLQGRDGAALAEFERLVLELDAASLWSGRWQLREIALVAPRIEISRTANGTANWAPLLAGLARDDGTAPSPVRVGRIRIERGEIAYADRSSPTGVRLRASAIALELHGFSTESGPDARYALSAHMGDGTRLSAKGVFGWPARSTSGELAVERLSAATLLVLGASPVSATSGTVRASARYSLRGDARSLELDQVEAAASDLRLALPGGTASVGSISVEAGQYLAADGSAAFGRLRVVDAALAASGEGAPQVGLAQLSLDGVSASIRERRIRIGRAALSGLNARDELDAQGASGLAGLLAPSAPESAAAADSAPSPGWHLALAQFEAQDSEWRVVQRGPRDSGNSTINAGFARIAADTLQLAPRAEGGVAIGRLEVTGGTLRHAPQGAAKHAIELREMTIVATQLRYPEGDPFDVSAAFVLPPAGRVSTEGKFDPRALSASLTLHAEALPLAAAQPWIAPHLALRIGSGTLSAKGRLRLAARTSPPAADFDGQVTVNTLEVTEAASGQPLFGAAALRARALKFAMAPLALAIGELELQAPTGRIEISKDGALNLGTLRPAAAEGPAKSGGSAHLPLTLRKVMVRDGRLDFADRSIQPGFSIRIDELAGTAGGLDASHAAKVALAGRVGEYGAAKIRGTLNPFEPSAQTDVTLELRNIDMSSLDPYSRRFAGYRIESGKLAGEMRYRVRAGRLEGDNHLVMQKLKLGERVASPQAADLPLELAIALLTDSEGRIAIDVPVRGNLGSPEFDLGAIVTQAIGNAIGKIVTAPFRLLAGLFGGGEEPIDRIYFEPGSAELAPPEREKIAALARALAARPRLGLRVTAAFDGRADAEGLRAAQVPVDAAALTALAIARADSARAALLAQGIDAGRIDVAAPGVASADAKLGVPVGLSLSAR